jgi:hypothetical protein
MAMGAHLVSISKTANAVTVALKSFSRWTQTSRIWVSVSWRLLHIVRESRSFFKAMRSRVTDASTALVSFRSSEGSSVVTAGGGLSGGEMDLSARGERLTEAGTWAD